MTRYASDKLKRLTALAEIRGTPIYPFGGGEYGAIELVQFTGSDEMIVHAAKVSFAREKEEVDAERLKGMIDFMMRNKHGSVFEHNSVTFLVKCPIFVAREWHRHRTQGFNEWSGRYSELEGEFYVPQYIRKQTGKPGAYTFEPIDTDSQLYKNTRNIIRDCGRFTFANYKRMLELGIAKEQARLVLPVNIYTKFYATANLRNWMKFLELRNSEHAMYEIRKYAECIEEVLHVLYPETMAAFRRTGVAP